MRLTNKKRALGVVSLVSSALLFAGGCSTETEYAIAQGDLVGSWKSSVGGPIRFLGDHEVKASGFSSPDPEEESCAGGGVGRWSFYVVMDEAGKSVRTSPEASEGSLISVRLSEGTERECHVNLSVIDEGRSLCIADLDQVCSSDLRFTRQ